MSSQSPQGRPGIQVPGGAETFDRAGHRNPLYLFACHLEWRTNGNVNAYEELLAGLDDPDERNRAVAEALLKRSSPRPQPGKATVADW